MQGGFEILPLDLNYKNLEIKFHEVREGESIHILVGSGIQDIMNKHGQRLLPLTPPENKFAVFNPEVRNSTEHTVFPKSAQILFKKHQVHKNIIL